MGNKSSKTPENKPPKNEEVKPKSIPPQHGVLSGRVSPSINIPGSQEDHEISVRADKINSNDPERCKNCGKQYRGDELRGFCSGECKMSAVADDQAAISALLYSDDDDEDNDDDDDDDDDNEEPITKSQGGGKTRKRKLRRKKRTKSRFKKKRGKRTRKKKSRKRKGGTISTGQPKTIVETKSNIEAKSRPSSVIAPAEMNRGESQIIQVPWAERNLPETECGRRCKKGTRFCRKFCGGRKTRKRRRKSKKKKRKSRKRRNIKKSRRR